MKPSSSMAEIQSLLGYTFHDPLLLEEALTHGSHSSRPTYQRLEFLGDAVLGLAVTRFLYNSNPSLGSGELTPLRSANVSTKKLARACVRHNLYRFLRRNDPVLDRLVFKFENSVRKELEDETEVSYGGSSRKAPKILADIVESTAAAIYIDSKFNLDVVWKVFGKILEPIIKNINKHLMNDSATVVTMKSSSSTADSRSLFGYTFHDPLLLEEALTHGSHSSRPTYQRLKFVGDAVLGLAVTRFLYNSNPSLGSEELTLLRSANVSTEKLARACVRHNLYRLLRRNDRVLDQLVFEFENSVREELEDETAVSYGGSSCKAPKILADIVESTAAAIYIDSKFNLDVVWKVFGKILEPIIKNINEHLMNDSATVVTMKSSSSTADSRSLFGYTFHDPLLLEEALTHGSHSSRPTYQRLEFVGDAVLGLAVTRFLYNSNPSLGSEELTLLRSANVSTEKLARACVRHNLYRLLRRNDRVLDQLVFEFENSVREELEDETAVSYGGSSCKAPKILADIVESTAAAVYIDSKYNLDVVWEVFGKILEPIIKNINEHPMTILKELMEKQHKKITTKESLENSPPTVEIFVDGDLLGKGSAGNKKIATLKAARNALQKLHPLQGANLDTEAEDGAAGELDSPQQRQNDFSTAKEFAIFFFFIVLIVLLVQHVSPDEATEI